MRRKTDSLIDRLSSRWKRRQAKEDLYLERGRMKVELTKSLLHANIFQRPMYVIFYINELPFPDMSKKHFS